MPRSAVPNTGSIITTIRTKWPWILAGLLVVVLVTMLSPTPTTPSPPEPDRSRPRKSLTHNRYRWRSPSCPPSR